MIHRDAVLAPLEPLRLVSPSEILYPDDRERDAPEERGFALTSSGTSTASGGVPSTSETTDEDRGRLLSYDGTEHKTTRL